MWIMNGAIRAPPPVHDCSQLTNNRIFKCCSHLFGCFLFIKTKLKLNEYAHQFVYMLLNTRLGIYYFIRAFDCSAISVWCSNFQLCYFPCMKYFHL